MDKNYHIHCYKCEVGAVKLMSGYQKIFQLSESACMPRAQMALVHMPTGALNFEKLHNSEVSRFDDPLPVFKNLRKNGGRWIWVHI